MKPFALALIAALPACASIDMDGPGVLSGGVLTTTEEIAVVEQVVRYGIANTAAPCPNHGAKNAYCLKVGASDQPPGKPSGWIGCGPIPGDCVRPSWPH